MNHTIKLIGISGSLRRASHNTATLAAAQELLPPNTTLEVVNLADLPFFNEDMEAELPPTVQALVARIAQADALLIATPEYNGMIPGVLKNALDWLSRANTREAVVGKVVGLISASVSPGGGIRAQQQLHSLLKNMRTLPHNSPEVLISRAFEKFDADGHLTDSASREKLQTLIESLVATVRGEAETVEVAA